MANELKLIKVAKKELRLWIRDRLASISSDSIISQSRNIERILISLPQYKNARQIGIYLSMPKNEVSTREIVLHALRQEKKVFVPFTYKVTPSSPNKPKDVMDLVSLHSQDDYESLQLDAWGIPTPSRESVWERNTCLEDDEITIKQTPRREPSHVHLDMIIMPGMAFDKKLGRLGHGKGFYDFFLQRYQRSKDANQSTRTTMPLLVGLGLVEQVVPPESEIPTDSSDWSLDVLILGDGTVIQN